VARNPDQPWFNYVPLLLNPNVLIDPLPFPKPKPDLVLCVVGRELAARHGCTSDMESEEPFLRTIFADSIGDLINHETRRVGTEDIRKIQEWWHWLQHESVTSRVAEWYYRRRDRGRCARKDGETIFARFEARTFVTRMTQQTIRFTELYTLLNDPNGPSSGMLAGCNRISVDQSWCIY
jgi:hypothetical protein